MPKLTVPGRTVEILLLAFFSLLGLTVAYLQSIAWYNSVGWDETSYLTLAQFWREGRFADFINPYWSPLYPAIIGIGAFFAPAAEAERTVITVVQFLCYVFFWVACVLFWREVYRLHAYFQKADGNAPLPLGLATVFMAALSLVSGLVFTNLDAKTPDLLAAAIYTLANFYILALFKPESDHADTSVQDQRDAVKRAVCIGLFMGVSYLAKAFFGCWAAICMVLLYATRKYYGLTKKSFAVMAAAVAVTAALYVVPISIQLHRPSIGEAGKYQIAFCGVDGLGPMVSLLHGSRDCVHPSRIFVESPRVYEFAEPFDVPYSPWFAPAYWNEGLKFKIDWPLYWQMAIGKLGRLQRFYVGYLAVFLIGLALATRRLLPFSKERLRLIAPVFAPSILCVIILFFFSASDGRYFIGLANPLFAGLLIALQVNAKTRQKVLKGTMALTSMVILFVFSYVSFFHAFFALPQLRSWFTAVTGIKTLDFGDTHGLTAAQLARLGVKPGDRIARIAKYRQGEFFWTRLARVRVVCESIDPKGFFGVSEGERQMIYDKLRKFGVKAIVFDWSFQDPEEAAKVSGPDWVQVPGTNNYIRMLDK
jgi:hypothetical protein